MTELTVLPTYIGVDVSAKTLDIYNMLLKKHIRINNSRPAINEWLSSLPEGNYFVILEPTGGYERKLRLALYENKIPAYLAHPNHILHFAKAQGKRAKADHLDAYILALYGQKEQPEATTMPSDLQQAFKTLVIRRKQLSVMIVSEKNRLNETTHNSIRSCLEESIDFLTMKLKSIEKEIKTLIKTDAELQTKSKILMSLKGVGITTSATLLAEMPELGKATKNEIAALAGVAPYNKESGLKKGRRKISGGRFNVRNALYMAAVVAVRFNPIMKKYYEHLREQKKDFKVAIVAVMRKMLITLNQMMREGKKWKHAI